MNDNVGKIAAKEYEPKWKEGGWKKDECEQRKKSETEEEEKRKKMRKGN